MTHARIRQSLATAIALFGALALAGCQSGGEQIGDLGASFQGSLGRDTQGSNRRMDVYGGVTAPTMPTIGAPGYGK